MWNLLLLYLALLLTALPLTSRDVLAQASEDEVEILTAVLTHQLEPIADSAKIVLDPTILTDGFASGPEGRERIERVARALNLAVAPLREVTVCPEGRRRPCSLTVDHIFQMGVPTIQGDRATVWVIHRWSQPGLRDPMPGAGSEFILARTPEGWKVTSRGAGFRS